ncbi:MAG: nickel-responsive transcriptional regulator NikR [Planctomycetes bacterium]|nr:nickel-responsive transcriptional regulator NikR [Planctomycetota bacterium]
MIVERFSISVEQSLLSNFDRYLKKKGYENRSEAVRDMIREAINEDAIQEENLEVVALLALLFDHRKRDLSNIVDDCAQDFEDNVLSIMHVPVGNYHCFRAWF